MGLWGSRSDPVDVAMTLASLADEYAGQCEAEVILLVHDIDPEWTADIIAVNLTLTLYAIALLGARQQMGNSSKFAQVELAMQPMLEAALTSKGSTCARDCAMILFPQQAVVYYQRASTASNPIFSIGSTFVEALLQAQPRSAAASLEAVRILTPFLGAVASYVRGRRI